MISMELGRSSPSATTLKLPSPFTRTREPSSGLAGEPGNASSHVPCDSANIVWPRPRSTSTSMGAPEATTRSDADFGPNATTCPSSARCGIAPIRAM
jgi:hypothetical protein